MIILVRSTDEGQPGRASLTRRSGWAKTGVSAAQLTPMRRLVPRPRARSAGCDHDASGIPPHLSLSGDSMPASILSRRAIESIDPMARRQPEATSAEGKTKESDARGTGKCPEAGMSKFRGETNVSSMLGKHSRHGRWSRVHRRNSRGGHRQGQKIFQNRIVPV